MSGIVGRVADKDNYWFKLSGSNKDDSGGEIVSFHTAFLDVERERSVMFACEKTSWPSSVAHDLGIEYMFMRNSTPKEIEEFVNDKKEGS